MKNTLTLMKRILFFIFLALFFNSAKSQIVMNEVSWTNSTIMDGFGVIGSDYVELYNATPGFSLSLDNYYLTNDPSNLYKWKFPNGLSLGSKPSPTAFMVVWLTGRNIKEPGAGGRYHTNFTLEQCKNQWLILTYNGVIKDSIFVRRTKLGDNWGRYSQPGGQDYYLTPMPPNVGFKLIQGGSSAATSFELPNSSYGAAQVFKDYAPVPIFTVQAGFLPPPGGFYDMWIPDTVNFQINYTLGTCTQLGGDIPCSSYTGCVGTPTSAQTYTYIDNITTPIPAGSGITQVMTAVTYPKPVGVGNVDPTIAPLYLPSFEETNTYFDGADLAVSAGFGVLSVVTDTTFFRTPGTQTLHVEYFDQNKFYSEAGGNIAQPYNDGWINQQRGFDVGFDDRTGQGCRLTGNIYNDATFGVSTRTVFPNFEIKAAGKDNFSARTPTISSGGSLRTTHLRDAFAQTYAMKYNLSMDGSHYKPIRTFMNGCYWGIYEFREILDKDYINYYFGINRDSSDILRQHGVGSVTTANLDTGWVTGPMAPGPSQSTVGVFNYGTKLPIFLSPSIYYNNTMKRLSKRSIMDFFIYNSYLINNDMPGFNTSWWRKTNNGNMPAYADTMMQWRYFMWDMNNILGLAVNLQNPLYPPVPMTYTNSNMNTTSPCIYTSTLLTAPVGTYTTPASAYVGHTVLLQRLLLNAQFKNEYMNRYMDLLNTTLRCDKMIPHFNYFRTIFTPEIVLHSIFWGNNQQDWEDQMDTLKIRLMQRCDKADSLLSKCMNMNGPYDITINVKPEGAGTVDFNSLHLTNFVWSGQYYQNKVPAYYLSYLEAWPIDTSLYVFDHWEWTSTTNSTTASPGTLNTYSQIYADSLSFIIGSSDNITAVFVDKRSDIVMPTGFTPNGDGINDLFSPLGAQARYARDYEMQVWNRWGEEVFRANEYIYGWDGTHKGVPAQTGVYAYMLKYKNIENESKIVKGNITLIR